MTNVFTIAAGRAFGDALAAGVIARFGKGDDPLALARVTIYVPTRRAVRSLGEAFARALGGAALMPDIRPLGDVDEDDFLFEPGADGFDLPKAIEPIRQRLLLATLVQRWGGGGLTFAQAASLARALARFLAEVQTQGADLAKLETLAPAALAQHWAEVKAFLNILREHWPAILAEEGAIDPAARRNAALAALTERIASNEDPVIAAGSTGSIPATALLLAAIARRVNGALVLPGLDRGLDEASWTRLEPGHPQFGLRELLQRIGIARGDVRDWTPEVAAEARARLLSETMRPAPTTDAWRRIAENGTDDIAQGLKGLSLLEADHPQEEAAAIALMLREVLETVGKTAALVTPDRNLARRVAAELGRWGIDIDDSAGRPLSHTPVGSFLCLLTEAAEAHFAPVMLLALLKHPLAAGGEPPAEFRAKVRMLDRLCLRGPRPDRGLSGIAAMIDSAKEKTRTEDARSTIGDVKRWFGRVQACLTPLAEAMAAKRLSIVDAVATHVKAAEALAATDRDEGKTRVWGGEAGEEAASLIAALAEAAAGISEIEPGSYPALFRALAEERAVRPAFSRHPRLAILGPLEARMQSFDLVVLGGLNEGSWPHAAANDPWLSRPMRKALGLEQPERAIGLSAHDFATLAAAPDVVLTRALKIEGSPTVASRWWQRLAQFARGLGLEERLNDRGTYVQLARAAAAPEAREKPMARPAPRPPVEKRPRELSVTEIETWLRDPYAIYARHVLKLSPLDPLEAEIGPPERGTAVHTALERFLERFTGALPADAELQLVAIAEEVFGEMNVPHAAQALWFPRFIRAARWFVGEERKRRGNLVRSHVEIRGAREFAGAAGSFRLRARADRIDVLRAGGAAIIDYKTGNPPTKAQVEALIAPQLPLEGAILAEGGFGEIGKLPTAELVYIRFGGGAEPGEVRAIPGDIAALVKAAEEKLLARIAQFDSPYTPYVPRVMPFRADQPGDYDHLARVREWSLTGWEGDEG